MKEVGVSDPVFISHPKMDSIVATADSIEIKAVVKTKSGIANASVYWTADTTSGFTTVPMQFISGDTAAGYIPPQFDETEIFYYISATSNSGRTVTKPLVAPDGYYKFEVDNNVTSIANLNLNPVEFYLSQNYPNPFNPATNLEFRIPKSGFVSLQVYDILGNEVATLVNEERTAGNYEIRFDASSLTSGVYFYRLSVDNFVGIKKMTLLR
jgi:hypothetical protein